MSTFYSAFDAGDCEMVELLLAKGAYVDPLADECGTPLHLAAKERQAGTMKILLDHKADVSITYDISALGCMFVCCMLFS